MYPLSDLELSMLRHLSAGKDEREIAKLTGVGRPVITEKMTKLYAEGYIAEKHKLAEKGYEALRLADAQPIPKPS